MPGRRHFESRPLFHRQRLFDDGAIVEMRLWRVSKPVLGSTHGLKYSLFHGAGGRRLVGYDNERGKGDHRHVDDHKERYLFISPEKLIADFLADVRRHRRDDG